MAAIDFLCAKILGEIFGDGEIVVREQLDLGEKQINRQKVLLRNTPLE